MAPRRSPTENARHGIRSGHGIRRRHRRTHPDRGRQHHHRGGGDQCGTRSVHGIRRVCVLHRRPARGGDPDRWIRDGGTTYCVALNNFWRTMSNLTINVNGAGQDGCRASANFWAVSQAVSLRRVEVTGGNLSLMDYCTAGPQFASGGFIADSKASFVINGSQQQWLTRNSEVGGWSNGVWNQVFAGVEGAPSDANFPTEPYTTLETTPLSREKPWLWVGDSGAWKVRVPAAAAETRGTTWGDGLTAGRTLDLSEFHIAKPGDSVQSINSQLARGKNLILTPGVYDINRSIDIKRPGTVVLGMGHATLTAVNGATPITVSDRAGIVVAGVTIDAGLKNSKVLMQVGADRPRNPAQGSTLANPVTLSDVYFRVGGPHIGKADVSLQIDADNVLVDHTWVWRADHGVEGFTGPNEGDSQRWATNTGRNGLIVNGDDVTATGLFVEHYQEHNTIWNGERGRVVLYQNELPYDPPSQADWTQPDGTLGYPGYKVSDDVTTHQLWGGGSYVFNRNDPSIVTENGFEVPDAPGVKMTHLLTVNLDAGTIRHVVNGVGEQVDATRSGLPAYVTTYP
ncbi:hypothetical protein C8E84_0918 [Ornithinibacter aureus]|nr:hypothetical protein C8E84_0918 [Ornithinibacter aureus]